MPTVGAQTPQTSQGLTIADASRLTILDFASKSAYLRVTTYIASRENIFVKQASKSMTSKPSIISWFSAVRASAVHLGFLLVVGMTLSGCSGFSDVLLQSPDRGSSVAYPTGQAAAAGATRTDAADNDAKAQRVVILLPLTGQHADIGKKMENAARLAISDAEGLSPVNFKILDTASTRDGALAATQTAVKDFGPQLILGPLLGSSLTPVAQLANSRGISVIGYTNDVARAHDGAWAFGLTPEQSVVHVLQWAARMGHRQLAIVAPETAYGRAAVNAAQAASARFGLRITVEESYGADDISKNLAAEQIGLQRDFFDAILIADQRTSLREIASLLYFHEVEPTEKRYLGLDGWDDPNLLNEQSLIGGVYAVPPTEKIVQFEQRYKNQFGEIPDVVSIAVYDSVIMAAELSAVRSQQLAVQTVRALRQFSFSELTRPQGFRGILGDYRLNGSGRVERLYEVKQLTIDGLRIVEPAPTTFGYLR